MLVKVAIYARISTNHPKQDIDRQIHECRRYCEIMGYEIVNENLDEGFARTTRNRPALDELIKDARQSKFKLVISDELSRFVRTPVLLLNLLDELKQWNIHLVSEKESIDTSTPLGEIVSNMIAAISKMELFYLSHSIKLVINNAKMVVLGVDRQI